MHEKNIFCLLLRLHRRCSCLAGARNNFRRRRSDSGCDGSRSSLCCPHRLSIHCCSRGNCLCPLQNHWLDVLHFRNGWIGFRRRSATRHSSVRAVSPVICAIRRNGVCNCCHFRCGCRRHLLLYMEQEDFSDKLKGGGTRGRILRPLAGPGGVWTEQQILLTCTALKTSKGSGVRLTELKQFAKSGTPEAQYVLGLMHQNGLGVARDYAEALRWYRESASKNFGPAQFSLGLMISQGIGIPPNRRQGMEWYERAAQNGFRPARELVAISLEHGLDLKQDREKAFVLQLQLAEEGHQRSARNVAVMYAEGIGTDRDSSLSLHWYKKAAESGDAQAAFMVACMYREGTGAVKDEQASFLWMKRSADLGFSGACSGLQEIYREGLLDQAKDAELAEEYGRRGEELFEAEMRELRSQTEPAE